MPAGTAEGAVAVSYDKTANAIALVQLRSETDFGAKCPDFVNLVNELAALVASEGEDAVDQRKDAIDDLKITLKENIQLGEVVRFEAAPGQRARLLPARAERPRRQRRARRAVEGGDQQLAHDIAVHIAFGKPSYLSRDDVPGRGGRGRAGHPGDRDPQRGQARAGAAQDRRGQAQRLVQAGAREACCSSSPTPRTTSRPCRRCSATPRSCASPRS